MNKHPILPNWQPPAQRRQRFSASRGLAMLKALRMRLAEENHARWTQTQFEFGQRARQPSNNTTYAGYKSTVPDGPADDAGGD